MNFVQKITGKNNTRTILSTLWIVVMFNMIFADILSFMVPGFWDKIAQMQLSQFALFAFAVLLEIPIIMIYLSKVLSYKAARWTNIAAAIITIPYIIFGGSLYLHYIFFATIETLLMVLVILVARNWRED